MKNKLATLFFSTFRISACTFGGGFVIVPLLRRKFVEDLGWVEDHEMLDLAAIAQSAPGPIAVNASVLVGYKVAGVPGALMAALGCALPPLIIISIISYFSAAFRDNPVVDLVMCGCRQLRRGHHHGRQGLRRQEMASSRDHHGFGLHRRPVLQGEHHPGDPGLRHLRRLADQERRDSRMIYLELLLSFMQIGLFSIGGGYAAMPLIQNQVVDLHPWLTIQQFADIMTIAEMTPGPIALNAATFVGIQVAGIPGALIATFGCVLPPFCIVLGLAWIYFKFRELGLVKGILAGIRPAVVAMIASAGVSLMILSFYGQQHLPADLLNVNWLSVALFGAGLFILRKWKLSPIAVMLGCGVIGTVLQLIF